MSRLWVVVYDITDNRNRLAVHRILDNHGNRVQHSVFECWLNDHVMTNLRKHLSRFIEKEDSLRWYPLCRRCQQNIDWWGEGEAAEDPQFYLI